MTPGTRVALFLASFFAANAVSAYMPLWFSDRGLSAQAIGQVLGLASLFKVLAGPGWGTYADRIGRRRPVMIAAAGTAMSLSLVYLPLHGFWPILIVAACQGVASSALSPLADSLALALAREGKLAYGPVRSAGSIAFMVATAAVGQAMAFVGVMVIPAVQALGYGLAAVFARLLPEVPVPASAARFGGWDLFRLAPFRLAVGCTALIQGSHAAYYGFAALAWRAQGIDDRTIGLLFAEGIIAEIALFLRGQRLIAWLGPAGLTGCAALAGVIRWSAMGFAPPIPWLVGLQILHAATFAMQHLSSMQVLSRSVAPARAATAQSLHAALGFGAPTGLMMLLTGFLYARYGDRAFWAMSACTVLALPLVWPLRQIMTLSPHRA